MSKERVNFEGTEFEDQGIKIMKLIGSGNWSDVYLAYNSQNTEKYAVKVISFRKFKETPKLKVLTEGEKNILKNCNHPNVVKFYKSFEKEQHQFIVLEYCDGVDLGNLLTKEGTLSQNTAIKYIFEIINGFKGLHSVNTMHRDFKVQNVMLHDECCKIVDLGFGKQLSSLEDVTQTKLGSNLTMAPEVMQRHPYGIKADIWSIGVVFYQLLEGTYPFKGRNIEAIMEKIKKNQIVFKKVDLSEESKDFIKRCLVVNPKERIQWKEIYEHPLFTRFSPNKIVNNSELIFEKVQENKKYYDKTNERDILKTQLYDTLDIPEKEKTVEEAKGKTLLQKKQFEEKQAESENNKEQSFKRPSSFKPKIQKHPQQQVQNIEEKQSKKETQSKNITKFEQHSKRQIQSQHQQTSHLQSFMQEGVILQNVSKIVLRYQAKANDCRFIPELLYHRYEHLRYKVAGINHQYYLSMLWKDSYLKLQQLYHSLQIKKNIFGYQQEIEIFFNKYYDQHSHLFQYLLEQIKKEFQAMVMSAKSKEHKQDHIFEQQSKFIQTILHQDISWNIYISDLAKEYWVALGKTINKKKHTQYHVKLLIYIFCLSDFQINNRKNKVSYLKVEKAICRFEIQRAERKLQQKLLQHQIWKQKFDIRPDCSQKNYGKHDADYNKHDKSFQNNKHTNKGQKKYNYLQQVDLMRIYQKKRYH